MEKLIYELWVLDLLTAEGEHVLQVGVGFADKAEAHQVADEAMAIEQRAAFAIFSKVDRRTASRRRVA